MIAAILAALAIGLGAQASAPAIRIDPPRTVVNQSACRDIGEPIAIVTVPSIGMHCPLYFGGQSMIDQGVATLVDSGDANYPEPEIGGNGTYWIAGHRSSHGSPFEAVPTIPIGATITVQDSRHTATYVVMGRSKVYNDVTGSESVTAVWRADHNYTAPRLTMQTCLPAGQVVMVYADLMKP